MTATLNVNLAACDCGGASPSGEHAPDCHGPPVLIPRPIPPSVTFEVVLGECVEALKTAILPSAKSRCGLTSHHERCPARLIRVSCDIGGDGTWAGSEVTDIAPVPELWGVDSNLRAIARDRWALVKALVTGSVYTLSARFSPETVEVIHQLHMHRDAVFAALAAMARAEDAHAAAYSRAWSAMGKEGPSPEKRSAHWVLAHYVDRLLEQVGNL